MITAQVVKRKIILYNCKDVSKTSIDQPTHHLYMKLNMKYLIWRWRKLVFRLTIWVWSHKLISAAGKRLYEHTFIIIDEIYWNYVLF